MIKKIKLLYIPTGEFLFSNIAKTSVYWDIGVGFCDTTDKLIIEIMEMNQNVSLYRNWRELNHITLPILKEELEILDD